MNMQTIAKILILSAGMQVNTAWSAIDTVDVLALYTSTLASSDPVARIANMENYANKALENSQANIRFRVVKIQEIDFPGAKTDVETLQNLQRNSLARSLRSQYGADLVIMMTPTQPYCGVGYIPRGVDGQINTFYKDYGFSIVGHLCTSSFAHELGHNLTLGHSFKQSSNGGLFPWGRGHGQDNAFVTTMAYTSAYSAPRVQIFATPDIVMCRGFPCGSPISEPDAADAVRALNVAGPQIADWFAAAVPPEKVNQAPNVSPDMGTTAQDQPIYIDALANDSDPEDDELSIIDVGEAMHGSVEIVDNRLFYTPDPGFVGEDEFEYLVSDGQDNTVAAAVTINVGLGLKYAYYEGVWSKLPDFTQLTADVTGVMHNFSIADRGRDNDYAYRFSGQIEIPESGEYRFFVNSDDVGQLIVDGQHLILVDAKQGDAEGEAAVVLTQGLHYIEVRYLQMDGDQHLTIDWQRPGGYREMLSSQFLRSSEPENVYPRASDDQVFTAIETPLTIDVLKNDKDPDHDRLLVDAVSDAAHGTVSYDGSLVTYQPDADFAGVDEFTYSINDGKGGYDFAVVKVRVGLGMAYDYYEGIWERLPDFDGIVPLESGFAQDFSLRQRHQTDHFAFRYRAKINIPADGVYRFYLISDEGSRLWIDGDVAVDNDKSNQTQGLRFNGSALELTAGFHDIRIDFFENFGRERLMVFWGEENASLQYLTARDLVLPVD